MRNLKRALSLAVASVMMIGMMVVGTGAVSYADVTSEDNQEAIEVLQTVGIMVGDTDGNFNPDANVTRNEMAVIMSNLMDYNVASYSGTTPFTDVPDWAEPYVAACYTHGITGGTSETTYSGDDPVTTVQAALMLMKALGYFQYQSDFVNGWELATVTQGNRIALFDDVDARVNEAVTRNEVAQLVLNTLESGMVEPDDSRLSVTTPDGTVVDAGNVTYYYVTSSESYAWAIKDLEGSSSTSISTQGFIVELGEYLYDGDLRMSDVNERDELGRPGTRWTYGTREIGTYADEPIAVYTAKVEKGELYSLLGRSNVNALSYGAGDSDVLSSYFNGDDTVIGNKNDLFLSNSSAAAGQSGKGVVTEVYQDSKNNVSIVQYAAYVAQANGDYNENNGELRTVTLTGPSGFTLGTLDSDDYDGLEEFADGDYILYVVGDNNEIQSLEKAEAVTGEVTAYSNTSADPGYGKGEGYVTIGDTRYDYGKYAETDAENGCSVEFTVGADATIVVDAYGYALYVDDASLSVGNYVYVNGMIQSNGFGNTILANAYFTDGTTGDITVDAIYLGDVNYVQNPDKDDIDVLSDSANNTEVGTTSTEGVQGSSASTDKSHRYDGWYSYSVSDGKYTLRYVDSGINYNSGNFGAAYGTNAVLPYSAGNKVTVGESVKFLRNTADNGDNAVSGNNNTIFLVDDGSKVTVYTGINNLPDISVKAGATGEVYVSYLMEKDDPAKSTAAVVYIYADDDVANIDTATSDDILYVLNRAESKYDRVNGDRIEVWNVVLNGEVTTIEAKENEFEAYGMYEKLRQDGDGYYEADAFTGEAKGSGDKREGTLSFTASGNPVTYRGSQIDYSSGTLTLGSSAYTVSSDTQIILILQDATGGDSHESGDKNTTNNLGAINNSGNTIVMFDSGAKHEVYNVTGQSLENYVRDRYVAGAYYGITDGSDSDLLTALYVVITDVSLLDNETIRTR